MTTTFVADMLSRSRGTFAPELFIRTTLFKLEGAGKTGHRLMPMARVQQKARGRTTGQPNIRPSLRNGFTAYT
jgi:hypothetical protein